MHAEKACAAPRSLKFGFIARNTTTPRFLINICFKITASYRGARPEAIVVAVLTAPWHRHRRLHQQETIRVAHPSTTTSSWTPLSPANSMYSFTSAPDCSPTSSDLTCSLPASPESLCCDASPIIDQQGLCTASPFDTLTCRAQDTNSEATYAANVPCVNPCLADTAGGLAARRSVRMMPPRPTPYSRHVPHAA